MISEPENTAETAVETKPKRGRPRKNAAAEALRVEDEAGAAATLAAQMKANQVGAEPFEEEAKIEPALEIIRAEQNASVSILQRRMQLGYGMAARIMDELERRGYVGPANGTEPREILHMPAVNGTAEPQKPKRKKLKAKSAQGDMVNEGKLDVPEPTSPLYIAGKRLAEAVEQEELAKDEKAEAMLELQKAMKNAKRYNYKASGYTFELQHFGASDKVKVIKPK